MSIITYPLDEIDYSASDIEIWLATRTSGILAKTNFPITLKSNNIVEIGKGLAWIKNHEAAGKGVYNTTPFEIDLGVADSLSDRIDVIAVRFNAVNNSSKIVLKTGTAERSPLIPTRSTTESIFELYLYAIYRAAGSVSVTDADITDLRINAEYCGLMADTVTEIDTEAINAQVNALILKLNAAINEATLGENGVNTYIQTGNASSFALNGVGTTGKFKAVTGGTISTASVNSETYTVNAGTENEIEIAVDSWYQFVLDTEEKTINFNSGGGLSNTKLALATATENEVLRSKTFYAADKTLKTGALNVGFFGNATELANINSDDDGEKEISYTTLKQYPAIFVLVNSGANFKVNCSITASELIVMPASYAGWSQSSGIMQIAYGFNVPAGTEIKASHTGNGNIKIVAFE